MVLGFFIVHAMLPAILLFSLLFLHCMIAGGYKREFGRFDQFKTERYPLYDALPAWYSGVGIAVMFTAWLVGWQYWAMFGSPCVLAPVVLFYMFADDGFYRGPGRDWLQTM